MRVQKRRRRGRPSWPKAAIGAVMFASIAAVGCALGPEQEPGCHDDSECSDGFTCRAGACFRATTDASPPPDGGDGDGG